MAQQAAGATDSALAVAKRAMEFDRTLTAPRLIYGTLLLDAGRSRDAITELERVRVVEPRAPVTLGALGAAYAAAGDRARAQEILGELERMADVPRAPSAIAKVRLALGDKEGAITWLQRAAEARDPAFASEPFAFRFWDPLRADPRFTQLTREIGLGLIRRSTDR
jgi:Flp pilus assembly protein TadD